MAILHFSGDKEFSLPVDILLTKLSDARFLVSCIPDVESVSQSSSTEGILVIKPGFSFVRGTLEVTLVVVEAQTNAAVRIQVTSKGIGSSSKLEASLTFAAHDGGSRVHWAIDVTELGGLMKAVPHGLVKAAAQKVIGDVWRAVDSALKKAG